MLYVVGTPIGNLEDLSLRQAKIVANADIILTEDTRSTGILMQRIAEIFNLEVSKEQKLISYYKEKEFEKLPEILELLQTERRVALISQAGMPLVSDPGLLLIKTLIKRDIAFEVIPGPTAFATALVYSGFNPDTSIYLGFFPKKQNEKIKLLKKIDEVQCVLKECSFVFYDSPNRIDETLEVIDSVMPEANICICRELTKKFEEIIRGKAAELKDRTYKGEITVVLSNKDKN